MYDYIKKNKMLRNFTKGVKAPYTENYNTLLKKVKTQIKRKIIVLVDENNIVKTSILP